MSKLAELRASIISIVTGHHEPQGPRCPDPWCRPEDGDEGCMAHVSNLGAVDALDFVWLRRWDRCPLIQEEEP